MSAIAVRLFRRMAAALVSYLPGMTARVPVVVLMLAALAVPVAAQESVEYYGTDALGSIRVVFDQSGGVIARGDYMPFGEEVFAPGPMPAERFTGQARDGEVGLDYFNARMLQVRTGRFGATDPVSGDPSNPQSWNRLTYALNQPLRFIDPSGGQNIDRHCVGSVYYCPNVSTGNPYDVEFDQPGQVTTGLLPPQSAEMAGAELRFEATFERDWVKPSTPGADITPDGRAGSRSSTNISTSYTITLNGQTITSDSTLTSFAEGVDRRARPMTEVATYGWWFGASIGGATIALTVPPALGMASDQTILFEATHAGATQAIIDLVSTFGPGYVAVDSWGSLAGNLIQLIRNTRQFNKDRPR